MRKRREEGRSKGKEKGRKEEGKELSMKERILRRKEKWKE